MKYYLHWPRRNENVWFLKNSLMVIFGGDGILILETICTWNLVSFRILR